MHLLLSHLCSFGLHPSKPGEKSKLYFSSIVFSSNTSFFFILPVVRIVVLVVAFGVDSGIIGDCGTM